MGAPITLTQRELLSLAPEIRAQVANAVAKKSAEKSKEEVFLAQMMMEETSKDVSE
jgi:hypothetical protein